MQSLTVAAKGFDITAPTVCRLLRPQSRGVICLRIYHEQRNQQKAAKA
ncbi:hypothetical protein AEST_23870 [Alishewanella aestuarii B11]|uniref:Uncharacterized protein n=1 Tax=Alishewanella aestuarii B11 TaxID=1197174 RepID=J2IC57_9ALTE|nr:hypothetical protein AEST_23870 [Alishewanella aestuarii B11]